MNKGSTEWYKSIKRKINLTLLDIAIIKAEINLTRLPYREKLFKRLKYPTNETH